MKFQRPTRRLVSAGCLSLLIAWQAFAASPIQQPNSIATEAAPSAEVAIAQDTAVTPAGFCDAGCDSCCGKGGCSGRSCCCDAVCCPKKVTEEVKKHCWKVKSKMICIPGFRFECNWGKNKCCSDPGTLTCGRVRCINVLEKHKYTCDKCGYEWSVKCVRSGKGGCFRGGGCNSCPSCGCTGCCASTEAETTDVQLASTTKLVVEAAEEKRSLSRRLMGWLK